MAFPTITTLPAAPQRGEVADTFTTKANAFVAALSTLESDINAWATYAEGTFTDDLNLIKTNFTDDVDLIKTDTIAARDATFVARDAAISAKVAAEDIETNVSSINDNINSIANFKGLWTDLTGALSMPATVLHSDNIWLLLTDLADVTTSEPSASNSDWLMSNTGATNSVLVTSSYTTLLTDGTINVANTAFIDVTIAEEYPIGKKLLIRKVSNDAFSVYINFSSDTESFTCGGYIFAWLLQDGDFIFIEKVSSDRWEILSSSAVDFSTGIFANGFLAVAHNSSPHVTTYSQDLDTFTKLSNPTTLPAGGGRGVAFSVGGTYMAVAHDISPYITIYKRSGDVFTKLNNPTTLPTGSGWGVAFSADGSYMAVAHDTSPYITIYKRSGDVFTKLSNPATLPTGGGTVGGGYGVAFSADGTYMAVAHYSSPYITIYKRSGDTFTKLSNPATLPTGIGLGVAFFPTYGGVGG